MINTIAKKREEVSRVWFFRNTFDKYVLFNVLSMKTHIMTVWFYFCLLFFRDIRQWLRTSTIKFCFYHQFKNEFYQIFRTATRYLFITSTQICSIEKWIFYTKADENFEMVGKASKYAQLSCNNEQNVYIRKLNRSIPYTVKGRIEFS